MGSLGTTAVKKLLDLIGDRFGETIKNIVDMAKLLLEDYDYMTESHLLQYNLNGDGSKTDAMVDRIMDKLDGPLSLLPRTLRNLVAPAIEKVLRLQISLGTSAVKRLLDLIGDHFGETIKGIVDMAKLLLEDYDYMAPNSFSISVLEDSSKTDAMVERIMDKI